jgi:hypothetical protein
LSDRIKRCDRATALALRPQGQIDPVIINIGSLMGSDNQPVKQGVKHTALRRQHGTGAVFQGMDTLRVQTIGEFSHGVLQAKIRQNRERYGPKAVRGVLYGKADLISRGPDLRWGRILGFVFHERL